MTDRSLASKAVMLLSLVPRRPREAVDRLSNLVEAKRERPSKEPLYAPVDLAQLVGLRPALAPYLMDGQCAELEREIGRREDDVLRAPGVDRRHAGDFALARACYAVCRATKPLNVVETGVAYGVTSAFILQALEANDRGQLHSIDLPPLAPNAERQVGLFVPDRFRHRWHIHRGQTRRVLPRLLARLQSVGLFVHDSLHTYSTMNLELQMVLPFLDRPAYVIADDIQGNEAFRQFVETARPSVWSAFAESRKASLFGLAGFD